VLFFGGKNKKARRQARDWWELARKVENYRGDLLEPSQLAELVAAREVLGEKLKDKAAGPAEWEAATKQLEPVLKKYGATFYPRHWWADNCETILVAAIVVIGIRTFFLQPFKIPTNSMHPTYHGRTAEVYVDEAPPNPLLKIPRLLLFGASTKSFVAPRDGEVYIPLVGPQQVPGRNFFVLPTTKARWSLFVGRERVTVDVPADFDMRLVYKELLGIEEESDLFPQLAQRPRVMLPGGVPAVATGIQAEAGETFVAFDILTGDNLVVDRMSYHFRRPAVGEPFVFRTNDIPGISPEERNQYYIKRLVGTPGDTLSIRPPELWRNGEPITGADAFTANAEQEERYRGYTYAGPTEGYANPFFSGRGELEVPEEKYFVMGDNSPNSADGRMWGLVPEQQAIGRALFIYYPFTGRWGPSE